NGVGKTSLLKILTGIDSDFLGKVLVNTKIGYLFNDQDDILRYKEKFSPGQYQKMRLGELLADSSTFLFIDEPTSHLDIDQKDQLIKSLNSRYKGFLLISHDRDFINQSCKKIFELKNGKLEIFNGDYAFYLDEREKRNKFSQREYQAYISEKKRLEDVMRNKKEQSDKIKRPPKRMGNSEARLHKMGGQVSKKKLDKQVKAIASRIDHLEVKEKPKEDKPIELIMAEKEKIFSKTIIKADNLNKSFGDKIIFNKADFIIENNKKVALLGKNGLGKTTLLKMILNREVWVHPNLRIGYYSQMDECLDHKKSILENILETSIYDQSLTRIILASLTFRKEDVFKPVAVLSDGERAKVKLAKILTSNFNFLIMDEPTNFLDIKAIEALENLLKGYDRPMIFVTHDVSFINNIASSLLIIEDHELKSFQGNLVQFKENQNKKKQNKDKNNFLLDFRLSSINNRLAMEISKEERDELESEYKKLLEEKTLK
ncbi:MAG: ATP-binding cassette domain-containing protein, partial [Bacillota bacterium]|nr:ATP-binding cassette domain-containing protein [Bacillota bacterium]